MCIKNNRIFFIYIRTNLLKRTIFYLFCFFEFGLIFVNGIEHHCNHQHPKHHEVIHGVHIEPLHVIRKRSISQPLRILLVYDNSVYRLPRINLDLSIIQYYQKLYNFGKKL